MISCVPLQEVRRQLLMLEEQFLPLVDDPISFLDELFQTKVSAMSLCSDPSAVTRLQYSRTFEAFT